MKPAQQPTRNPFFCHFAVGILFATIPLYGAAMGDVDDEKEPEGVCSSRTNGMKGTEQPDAVKALLHQNKALKELAAAPELLALITTIVEEKGSKALTQAPNLHARYQLLINTLWEQVSGNYTNKERQYTEALLGYLAFYAMQHNQLTIACDVIKKAATTLQKNCNWQLPDKWDETQLLYASRLLQPTATWKDGDVASAFIHPTLQAYYTAYYLACVNPYALPNTLRQHKYNPSYQLVWCCYIGFLKNQPPAIIQFMEQLNADPRDVIGYAHTMLQAHLLCEVSLPPKGTQKLIKQCGLAHHFCNWFDYLFQQEGGECSRSDRPLLNAFTAFLGALPTSLVKTRLIETTWLPKLTDKNPIVRRNTANAFGQLRDRKLLANLLKTLKDTCPSVRSIAASTLAELGDEAALRPLLEALNDDNDTVRYCTVTTLGKLGTKALPALVKALHHKDCKVRTHAAKALGKLGDRKALPGLLESLNEQHVWVRIAIIEALGKIGDGGALLPLLDRLQDKDDYLRNKVKAALHKLHLDTRALPHLLHALKHKNIHVRYYAAEALAKLEADKVLPPLLAALEDTASYVRETAVYALGRLKNRKALPHLLYALHDVHDSVKIIATEALGKLKDKQALRPLHNFLHNEGAPVRYYAAVALAQLGDDNGLPHLLDALQHQNSTVRYFAVVALSKLGPKALPALLAALKNQDKDVRCYAVAALRGIGDPGALPALLDTLQDENKYVRRQVAATLGKLGDDTALPGLLSALQDKDKEVRCYAIAALGEIGDAGALPALLTKLDDTDRDLRAATAKALGEIGDVEALSPLLDTLQDYYPEVCKAAYHALTQFTIHEVPALREALHATNPAIRLFAQVALQQGFFPYEEVKTSLINALRHNHNNVRFYTIKVVGKLAGRWKLPPLIKALQDPTAEIRAIAATTLGEIGNEDALPPLLALLNDRDKEVRKHAVAALDQFSWSTRLPILLRYIEQKSVQAYLINSCIKGNTPLWVDEERKQLSFIVGHKQGKMPITSTNDTLLNGLGSSIATSKARKKGTRCIIA